MSRPSNISLTSSSHGTPSRPRYSATAKPERVPLHLRVEQLPLELPRAVEQLVGAAQALDVLDPVHIHPGVRALPYLGVVLLWAACALAVWFAVEQALELDDTRLKGPARHPGPAHARPRGAQVQRLLRGESHTRSGPGGDALDDPEATRLGIRIRSERRPGALAGRLLRNLHPLRRAGRYGYRDRPRAALGRYRMTVTSSEELGYSSQSVALGEPPAAAWSSSSAAWFCGGRLPVGRPDPDRHAVARSQRRA